MAAKEAPRPNFDEPTLAAFLVNLVSFLQSPLGIALLQISALTLGRPEFSRYRVTYWTSRMSLVNPIFEHAMLRAEIPVNLDMALAVELLAGPIYMRTLFTTASVDDAAIEKIVAAVIKAIA